MNINNPAKKNKTTTIFIAIFQNLFYYRAAFPKGLSPTCTWWTHAKSAVGNVKWRAHVQEWSTSCGVRYWFLRQKQTDPACGFWFACLVSLQISSGLESGQLRPFGACSGDMESKALDGAGVHVEDPWLVSSAVRLLSIQLPSRSNAIRREPGNLAGECGCPAATLKDSGCLHNSA